MLALYSAGIVTVSSMLFLSFVGCIVACCTDNKVGLRPHGHVISTTPDGNPNPSEDVTSIKQSHSSGSQANVYLDDTSSLVMRVLYTWPLTFTIGFRAFFM